MTYCLKRKNKKRFLSFQSMPNLNFAEALIRKLLAMSIVIIPQKEICFRRNGLRLCSLDACTD